MQGLFNSVTATFTTLVFALALFVVEHYQQFSYADLGDARQTRAQATHFLETLEQDVANMLALVQAPETSSFACRVSMTRNGRTRFFTFPTLSQSEKGKYPEIVQVTYELEGQAMQIDTRNGKRDLYRLRRHLDGDRSMELPVISSDQIVDFLVELIPTPPENMPVERIVSGSCPTDLDQVYIEFYVAVSDVPRYVSINKFSTTIQRSAVRNSMAEILIDAD